MTTRSAICRQCGDLFDSASATFNLLGRTVTVAEHFCETCQAAKEAALIEPKRVTAMLWEDLCPRAYQGFDIDRLPESSRATAKTVLMWQWSPRGVGLIGDSRAGKTFVIHELARRQHEQGRTVRLLTGTGFAYAAGSPEGSERRSMIDRSIRCDVLVLDDLDKMKLTDRVEADLFHVIEERRRAMRPMLVTVNARGVELEAMMSATGARPVVNRLREDVCRFYAM